MPPLPPRSDKTVIVWELERGADDKYAFPKRALHGHSHFVQDVVISSDGQFALSGSWDATLRLWDLNTGNTTYKAVQRSAHVVSVGPMLQGLRKPVNDLSRGALVDDIVFTIALTAIQADRRR